MSENITAELLALSQKLLEAIDRQDWSTYCELCDESLTAFEPEGVGHLIAGMPFHEFYFREERSALPIQSSISSPQVRVMGESALVTYIRLTQRTDVEGRSATVAFEETRIWQLQQGRWKHVHFHRSCAGRVQL